MNDVQKIRAMVENWVVSKLDAERMSLTAKIDALAKLSSTTETQIRIEGLNRKRERLENEIFQLELLMAKLPLSKADELGPRTWSEYLNWLNEGENRQKVGREMELMRISVQRCREKLSDLHQYQDLRLDRPITNAETVHED